METWLSGTLWILPPQRRKQLLSRKTCSCCISVNCLLLWEVDLRLNATFSCTKSWQFLIHFSLAWYSYCVVGGHLRLFPQVYSWLWNENISGGDNKLTEFAEFIQINDMMYSQWFSRCWLNSSAVIMAAWSSMVGEDCHFGHIDSIVSQDGPDDYSVEDFSWHEVSLWVRRLAGFSLVGQYLHVPALVVLLISVVQWETKEVAFESNREQSGYRRCSRVAFNNKESTINTHPAGK